MFAWDNKFRFGLLQCLILNNRAWPVGWHGKCDFQAARPEIHPLAIWIQLALLQVIILLLGSENKFLESNPSENSDWDVW